MGNGKVKNKKIDSLSGKDIAKKILDRIESIEERQRNLENDVAEIKDLLDEKEVKSKPEKKPILQRKERQQAAEVKRLIGKRSKEGEGIDWRDIKDIFDVKRTQAYDIFGELAKTYHWIGELDRHPRNVLVHKKNFLIHYTNKWYPDVEKKKKKQDGGDLSDLEWRELMKVLETNVMSAEKKERVELLNELQASFLEE